MRIYTATFASVAFSAAGSVMELQVPSGSTIVVLRAWIGAAEGTDPVAEVQEVGLYGNDAAATGGTAMTEQELQGGADSSSSVTGLRGPTIGATPIDLYMDAFHLQNGWLYLPVPEERIQIIGTSADPGDNVGIRFPVAPDASITISGGMTWGEL